MEKDNLDLEVKNQLKKLANGRPRNQDYYKYLFSTCDIMSVYDKYLQEDDETKQNELFEMIKAQVQDVTE